MMNVNIWERFIEERSEVMEKEKEEYGEDMKTVILSNYPGIHLFSFISFNLEASIYNFFWRKHVAKKRQTKLKLN